MSRHEQHISRQIRQGLKGTQVTFMTVDESSRIDAKVLAALGRKRDLVARLEKKPRAKRFKPLDVACVKCGAAAGEHCSPRRRPVHSERWWDVQAAQAAFDVLTEQEV
jgi:hypothetical protein